LPVQLKVTFEDLTTGNKKTVLVEATGDFEALTAVRKKAWDFIVGVENAEG
jgi:hypothetical protein